MINQRYFSVNEAEEILPKIKKLLLDARILRDTIAQFIEAIDHEPEFHPVNDEGIHFCRWREAEQGQEFHKLQYEFYQKLNTIMKLGCWIKDLDRGIVDFPSKHKNRDIFLCWKIGDSQIKHWHEYDKCGEEEKDVVLLKE